MMTPRRVDMIALRFPRCVSAIVHETSRMKQWVPQRAPTAPACAPLPSRARSLTALEVRLLRTNGLRGPATVLLLASLMLAGCADTVALPTDPPDLEGRVVEVTSAEDADALGRVVVEGEPGATIEQASVQITDDTVVLLDDGGPTQAAFADLAEGQTVRMWFTGPALGSFPVQATAEALVIVDG
jgi:hypothetical protein